MAHDEGQPRALELPIKVVGPIDISRMLRELETVEDFINESTIRSPGASLKLPRTGLLLEEFMTGNQLNLLQPGDRALASSFLTSVFEKAPVIHISLASDPSAAFTGKILTWLRANIHRQLLLRIGLEPTIAAGCIVRTTSRQFDFSLRQHFAAQRTELAKLLNPPVSSP
jgi:hypothetical protein